MEFMLAVLLTAAVFSFFWRESFLFRGAELLAYSVTLALISRAVVKYFFEPQLVIASEFMPRYLWFVIGSGIVLGEIPKLKKIARVPMSIFVGVGTALLLEGIVEGFMIPQISAFLHFDPETVPMLKAFAVASTALAVMMFFVLPAQSKNSAFAVLKVFSKIVLFFVLGVMLSGLVFTVATYISGRISAFYHLGRSFY